MATNEQHTMKQQIPAHTGLRIYLQRSSTSADGSPSVEIAVIEDKRHAEHYESRGYTRCSCGTSSASARSWVARSSAPAMSTSITDTMYFVYG